MKNKYFIFSDESGSWHDETDVYVRSWIIVHESDYDKLVEVVDFIAVSLNTKELRWKTVANNRVHWNFVENFNFRVFLTVSFPRDINWEQKYKITRNFDAQIDALDFGKINIDLISNLKKKMFDDIRNVLFLNFYEKTHIENAKIGIEKVLPKRENLLVYRVDPPQMSKDGWKTILKSISPDVEIEFPQSQKSEGIQFADIVAGCFRSLFIKDSNYKNAIDFYKKIKDKIIRGDSNNPNPNLIFYSEIGEDYKQRCKEIWKL